MMRFAVLPLAALLLAVPREASATWSITAVDPRTREVGIAGASCTPNVIGIAGVVPGRGVIATQALTNGAARQRGMEMLRAGASSPKRARKTAFASWATSRGCERSWKRVSSPGLMYGLRKSFAPQGPPRCQTHGA